MYDKKLLSRLKKNYLAAKALEDTIREQAEEIGQKILNDNEFFRDDEFREEGNGNRITRTTHDFLMSDEDFERYTKMRYAEYVKAGIADPRGWEWIPGAEEEKIRREAEQMLVDFALDIMPEGLAHEREVLRRHNKDYKIREQILDSILRLEA